MLAERASEPCWFDAHLDLAYLQVAGRDMTQPLDRAGGPPDPAVTLPTLAEGGVGWAMGTIYTESGAPRQPGGYAGPDDVEGAHAAGAKQLWVYQDWERRGLVRIVRRPDDLLGAGGPLRLVLLMEGADPIRGPGEAAWWFEQGVRAVGLSWSRGSRYAGGNATPPQRIGLTPLGRDLVAELDRLGIIHDLAHLDDASAARLLEQSRGPVSITHTALRSLVDPGNQRLASDALVREVADRGGVVGLNLYGRFLSPGPRPALVSDAVAQLQRLRELAGADRVGLGSDMDGGFGASALPEGIRRPADLEQLAEALAESGWSQELRDGFRSGNWLEFLRRSLPG